MVGGLVPKFQTYVLNSFSWPPMMRKLLIHPAGPFTIHFWCPWAKWAIVVANIADLKVPAENISTVQQGVIMLTGLVWTRYSTQVKPFNVNLMLVNFFMACSAIYQISRKLRLNNSKPSSA
ncbi:unnamed protein product [Blepharisma stoltei]|uniref:Mitochondrial pyruvate carrier n=1 Tax=Blepharisma stoltei TaxID=1481888 RepID=A0AAU9IK37_9CILI|nr:unnamed protein product [Blepharisma stoltei]